MIVLNLVPKYQENTLIFAAVVQFDILVII